MTLLALDNVLMGNPMSRRFLNVPACAAYDLLLQERMPQAIRPVVLLPENGERYRRRITALSEWIVPFAENASSGANGSATNRRPTSS